MHYEEVEYITEYNELLRPITNKQIITVEISPTGSGKNTFYKNSTNTIILVPTNAIVRQHNGMISHNSVQTGERDSWKDIRTSSSEYMTYDKFAGHIIHENISNFNVIIDEAHLVLASLNEIYYGFLKKLLLREVEYKELKLISATLRKEILEMYSEHIFLHNNINTFNVRKYYNPNRFPKINFVKAIPKISASEKTLFFINSKDKMIQIKDYYKEKFPNIRVVILSAAVDELPLEDKFVENDLILSTCVIKQGYSIRTQIDKVIVHNVFNAIGALEILQYIARPRNSNPKIFIVSAKTHFLEEGLTQPNINYLLSKISDHISSTQSEINRNLALQLNKLVAYTRNNIDSWNRPGLAYYYEEGMRYYELYSKIDDDFGMKKSIKSLLPNATITYDDTITEDELKFNRTNLNLDYTEYEDIYALRQELDHIIRETDDDRIKNKANILFNIEPITSYEYKNTKETVKYYKVKDKIQVRQILEPKILERCKQHKTNIEKGVYTFRDRGDQRSRIQIGNEILVSKLKRKIEFLGKNFFKSQINYLEIAEKVYSFKRFSDENCIDELSEGQKKRVQSIKITSKYPVELDWIYECSPI